MMRSMFDRINQETDPHFESSMDNDGSLMIIGIENIGMNYLDT